MFQTTNQMVYRETPGKLHQYWLDCQDSKGMEDSIGSPGDIMARALHMVQAIGKKG